MLKWVLHSAREVTGARYAALGVRDESGSALGRFLTVGIDDETRRLIGPLPTGRGVLGHLIRNQVPRRLGDVGSHPFSYGLPVGHPPMSSFLGVPIVCHGQPFGNLYLTEKQGAEEFTERTMRRPRCCWRSSPAWRSTMRGGSRARSPNGHVCSERFTLWTQRSRLPERLGARRISMRFDVTIDLAFEQGREPRRHSPEPETAVYRIVQEALTNATKHGAAARATVEVLEGDHDVRVTVRDDGSGFDPTAAASGFGLAGMRERTELLKGEISVESAPGEGTTVRVVLPVTRRPAPESRRLTVRGG